VPLIQEQLQEGNDAGLEHYRQAGELLIEVRDSAQVPEFKWGKWLKANCALSRSTAYDYMLLAERMADPSFVRAPGQTLWSVTRAKEQKRRKARREAFKLHKSVDLFDVRKQDRAEELTLLRKLAIELIDVGFKALATRLHPDHGGTENAMRRLNRVRRELKAVAQTRRFES
jgi:hypothetical protein